MQRLVLICLACMAFTQGLPFKLSAHPPSRSSCAACPISSGHVADCSDRGCIGCSLEPSATAIAAPLPKLRTAPVMPMPPIALIDYRPGLDPPPPRPIG